MISPVMWNPTQAVHKKPQFADKNDAHSSLSDICVFPSGMAGSDPIASLSIVLHVSNDILYYFRSVSNALPVQNSFDLNLCMYVFIYLFIVSVSL